MAHLGAKTESVSIGKSGTGIVENTGAVDFSLEVRCTVVILGNDGIRMSTAVFVNVIYRVVDV